MGRTPPPHTCWGNMKSLRQRDLHAVELPTIDEDSPAERELAAVDPWKRGLERRVAVHLVGLQGDAAPRLLEHRCERIGLAERRHLRLGDDEHGLRERDLAQALERVFVRRAGEL